MCCKAALLSSFPGLNAKPGCAVQEYLEKFTAFRHHFRLRTKIIHHVVGNYAQAFSRPTRFAPVLLTLDSVLATPRRQARPVPFPADSAMHSVQQ